MTGRHKQNGQMAAHLHIRPQRQPVLCLPTHSLVPLQKHWPRLHSSPAPHARPHCPQFFESVCRLASQPAPGQRGVCRECTTGVAGRQVGCRECGEEVLGR